jgi:hypothetical protein
LVGESLLLTEVDLRGRHFAVKYSVVVVANQFSGRRNMLACKRFSQLPEKGKSVNSDGVLPHLETFWVYSQLLLQPFHFLQRPGEVIAEHARLRPRDDERLKTGQPGKPEETVIAGPSVIKTKSCSQQVPRQTDLYQQNQKDIKIKSDLLVAGAGFEPATFGL